MLRSNLRRKRKGNPKHFWVIAIVVFVVCTTWSLFLKEQPAATVADITWNQATENTSYAFTVKSNSSNRTNFKVLVKWQRGGGSYAEDVMGSLFDTFEISLSAHEKVRVFGEFSHRVNHDARARCVLVYLEEIRPSANRQKMDSYVAHSGVIHR